MNVGTPLAGLTVLVTRPAAQTGPLVERLRRLGAHAEVVPTIRIRDPDDPAPLREAARELGEFDWAVFTSVNGVERFLAAAEAVGIDPARHRNVRYAAIGPETARVLEAAGCEVEVTPASYRAEALADALRDRAGSDPAPGERRPLEGLKILLARAAQARAVLPEELRAAGAEVREVAAYETDPNHEASETLRAVLAAGVDWITFTASSAVRAFVELGGDIGGARIAVIGPITEATARELRVRVDLVAEEFTIPGLVAALVARVSSTESAAEQLP